MSAIVGTTDIESCNKDDEINELNAAIAKAIYPQKVLAVA
jgi:hypothetical protein